MVSPHSAAGVAAELRRQIPGIGEVKLQKLLYYVQGRHLEVYGTPAFGDQIVAFDMGPVVASVWRQRNAPPPTTPITDDDLLLTIGFVVSKYGQLYGTDLIQQTHLEVPWLSADGERRRTGARSAVISVDRMREFFTGDGRTERSVPDTLFDQIRHRRDVGPLPPANPVDPDRLLSRVDQGV
jgi:uncharacterized phage-associated protein